MSAGNSTVRRISPPSPDPGGGDFTRRGEMEAAGAVQLRHKGGANVRFQQAAAVGIEPDARQRLNEPAADVPPEMVVVGGDVAPLGLEILPQAGGAAGHPVTVRGEIGPDDHIEGQIAASEIGQHMENYPAAQDARCPYGRLVLR